MPLHVPEQVALQEVHPDEVDVPLHVPEQVLIQVELHDEHPDEDELP